MIYKEKFFWIFFIFVFVAHARCEEPGGDGEYPNIEDLFKIPDVAPGPSTGGYTAPHAAVTVDINKIDVDKLRRKLDQLPPSEMYRKWRAFNHFVKTYNATGNETVPLSKTRRYRVDLEYGWWKAFYFVGIGVVVNYKYNTRYAQCAKFLDLCLQIIYMARHKIMLLERTKHFNRKDTGYRIAFIYKNLRRIYRRFVDIYKTTVKIYFASKEYTYAPNHADSVTNFHQKALRLYVDFLYYYWVMIALDKEYSHVNRWRAPRTPDLENVHSTTQQWAGESLYVLDEWQIWG